MTDDAFHIDRSIDPPVIRDRNEDVVAVKVEPAETSDPYLLSLDLEMIYGESWTRKVDGKVVEVFRPVTDENDDG